MLNDPKRPRYLQIQDQLKQRIAAGEWSPGERLPSETDLTRQMAASQGTIRKALGDLVQQNVIIRKQGSGTFLPQASLQNLTARFLRLANAKGDVIDAEHRCQVVVSDKANQEQASALRIRTDDPIWVVERLLTVHGKPSVAQRLFISQSAADLKDMPNDADLYHFLQRTVGISLVRVEDKVEAIEAPASVAWMLDCNAGEPLLRLKRKSYDAIDRVIEASDIYVCNTEDWHHVTAS